MAHPITGHLFDLAKLSSHWTGSFFAEFEAPITRGITKRREQLQGQTRVGSALISEFDYDGLLEHIHLVLPCASKTDADVGLLQRLEEHEQSIFKPGASWQRIDDNVLPQGILSTALDVMAGDFGNQLIRGCFESATQRPAPRSGG